MKIINKYRLYGRSKCRGKNVKITNEAKAIRIKKIDNIWEQAF